jgi:hypothetical protein
MARGEWCGTILLVTPLAVILGASACSDNPGSAGSDNPGSARSADPGPRSEERTPLNDETEASALLGFSLEQVLPVGAQAATLTWNEGRSGIAFSPASATAALRWSLELPARGSEAFRIDDVNVECDRERFVTNDDSLCADQLEAALLLHLESDDGALAEVLPVTFIAQAPNAIQWSNLDIDVSQLAGNFSITASEGDPSSLRLAVLGSIVDGEATGSLVSDVILERTRTGGGENTLGAIVTVAEWRATPASP